MLRKTIFADAAALCFAASAASTNTSAAPAAAAFRASAFHHGAGRVLVGHGHRYIGTGVHRGGGRTRCWDAECGGGTVSIDDRIALRGCHLIGLPVPRLVEGLPGMPRGATRPLRR